MRNTASKDSMTCCSTLPSLRFQEGRERKHKQNESVNGSSLMLILIWGARDINSLKFLHELIVHAATASSDALQRISWGWLFIIHKSALHANSKHGFPREFGWGLDVIKINIEYRHEVLASTKFSLRAIWEFTLPSILFNWKSKRVFIIYYWLLCLEDFTLILTRCILLISNKLIEIKEYNGVGFVFYGQYFNFHSFEFAWYTLPNNKIER